MKKTLDPRIQIYQNLVLNIQISSSKLNNSDSAQKLQKILANYTCEPLLPTPEPLSDSKGFKNLPKIKKVIKCFRCAQESANHRCGEFFCNECSCVGHITRECPWKFKSTTAYDGRFCQICRVRGHTAAACVAKGYISEGQAKKMRCFVCLQPGHIRCDKL